MVGLTDKQRDCLNFIRRTIDRTGAPPTYREIGAHMGIGSTNAVTDHLDALEKKGFISRDPYKARTIRLTSHVDIRARVRKLERGLAEALDGFECIHERPLGDRPAVERNSWWSDCVCAHCDGARALDTGIEWEWYEDTEQRRPAR